MSKQTPGPQTPSIPEDALDFTDEDEGRALGQPPFDEVERPAAKPADEPGLTGGATLSESEHEDNVSLDDLSPDTLFDQSGARSPLEQGDDGPEQGNVLLRDVDLVLFVFFVIFLFFQCEAQHP